MQHQPAVPNTDVLDFSTTPLGNDYSGFYIKVLDNVFTPSECASFISLAESDAMWEVASVTTNRGVILDQSYRNSGRILRFDHETAGRIYQRLPPFVQELVEIRPGEKWEGVVGYPGRVAGLWKMVG